MNITIKFKLDQLDKIIEKYLISRLSEKSIFTFSGPLGAGKTTIIKEFLKKCGVNDIVTSPTFNYLNIYKNKKGVIFNHFDLYRLSSIDSFIDLGFDEYLYESSKNLHLCFIEWPAIIASLLEDKTLEKKICNICLDFDLNNFDYRLLKIY